MPPNTLLCTDVAHQDHVCMVYTCATQRPLDLSCMHMHSAVARDSDASMFQNFTLLCTDVAR